MCHYIKNYMVMITYVNRLTFCSGAQDRLRDNDNLFHLVLSSWLREVEHQIPWFVWCGILGDKVIGPYIIDGTLTGAKYRNFLTEELPLLLEDVPLETRSQMWYQHEGCPAHYC